MASQKPHPALARILRQGLSADTVATLGDRLTASDLTTLLLEVARHRASRRTPTEVLRQYEQDRFVGPAAVGARLLLRLEQAAMDAVGDTFTPVITAPLVPFGAHVATARVDQNIVVSTMRATEVAADPTTSLALEAAVQRRALLADNARSAELIRLSTVTRVTRAQRFEGPRMFAHFCLLGLVTAGRDRGNQAFEQSALIEQVEALTAVVRACGFDRVVVKLSDLGGQHTRIIDAAILALNGARVVCTHDPHRSAGRGYYPNVCFKLAVECNGEEIEVGDGGIVDWTQSLLGNRKERLMTAGLSLERLATL